MFGLFFSLGCASVIKAEAVVLPIRRAYFAAEIDRNLLSNLLSQGSVAGCVTLDFSSCLLLFQLEASHSCAQMF